MKLFLRIFISYWVIFLIANELSDRMFPDQLRRPPYTRSAMISALSMLATPAAKAYETGGCGQLQQTSQVGDRFYLADAGGKLLCGKVSAGGIEELAQSVHGTESVRSRRYDSFQVVAAQVKAPSGRKYVGLLVSTYPAALKSYAWYIPGWTTFTTSSVVSMAFTIMLLIPVRRLRRAASEIARGHLHARVRVRESSLFTLEDEMHVLMRDFNSMANRLEALVDSQRLLLRDVSHELRSPLARLSVALELARLKSGGEALTHLARIDRESERLNNLIGQLLSLSAMETNLDDTNASLLPMEELVRQILPDVEYEASVRNCVVDAKFDGNYVVKANHDLLQSALENVLRNAVRYSPEGGRITVDLESSGKDGVEMAVVRVTDAGPGVPHSELQAILRPFYRVDKSRRAGTGGFGVGLAIADRAVRLYGGTIHASNHADGGLVVEVCLPMQASVVGHA